MKNLLIYWPSADKQRKIVEALSVVHTEIGLLKQTADKYRVQKRGLMQKLLTGQWRINLIGRELA